MARIKKTRLIQMAPHFCGFIPQGLQCKGGTEVIINFEEYEALNLCDYELLTQAEAAKMMKISRPTFTRIYESVRRKIAKAFIEGSCIRFEGGNFDIAQWYKCEHCKISFTLVENAPRVCPLCKNSLITENK
ncbi:MAG TPA: DUF134 domain-containing protein [Bacteroidales bacterium]|nr:DUF134 domain-containing protein [Bacteroidales bacterium]HOK99106.1 DUF134 domain-containing protein [Bacteroidales bacterium]HPO65914.1 DUF134 domain-containing protein [Bacteroidales bacterium]